jgi:hypothetical protein
LVKENRLCVPISFMHELLVCEAYMVGWWGILVLLRLWMRCISIFIVLKWKRCVTHIWQMHNL